MTTIACDFTPVDFSSPQEGEKNSMPDDEENQAMSVITAHGRVLHLLQARTWLKGVIRDPESGSHYDGNASAFIRRAQHEIRIFATGEETGISRYNAIMLHRLFLIRETATFKRIITTIE